ncbi:transmembrane sensor [Peteryoungia aggregata LMG 23059]|uniref:Transmembrane sensor n=1 Tax=Peteryoungia aggregata LMG 23059 TaxID=1368425 RepID=A0ABU0GDR5_9HYPH|nr:FecR family protein [Peteryoungia aggregata]MDQ0423499.1 transmembrane sensor [Peteryoungia aggregata LMG 23059]
MGHQDAHETGQTDSELTHADPVGDQALDWFVRLRGAEPDGVTEGAFKAWLGEDPRHEAAFRALETLWNSKPFLDAVMALPVAKSALIRPKRRFPKQAAALAASVLLAAGVWQYPALNIAFQADYLTGTGSQTTVSLPDGSTMMLNTGTAVALDFDAGKRHIRLLRGEAFFDVVHDAAHPFTVSGQYGAVEVLGTAFSVKTGDDEDEVVLERGRVQVLCLCENQGKAELAPGEAVSVTASAVSPVHAADPSTALAWRDGRIIFENARLGTVLEELRRYHRGPIMVADERVNLMVVTGNYRLDDVEGALKTLADAAGVGFYRIPGGLIILR